MNLELVSFALCPFVHRVTTLLHEKGVPFSVRYIDLRNKPDWFLALSPRSRVPVLVADGKALFESAAILEFLDETQGTPRLPADPFERARQRAYVSFSADVFAAQYRLLIAATDAELEAATAGLQAQLGAFEQALADGPAAGPWFGGESFGLVDAAIAPALQRAVAVDAATGIDSMGGLARVKAWAQRLAAHPSVQAGLPPDFDRLLREALGKSGALGPRLRA